MTNAFLKGLDGFQYNEINSTHNKGKSAVEERFMRTLKNEIFQHITTVPKNVYIDKQHDIVDRYNNTSYRTIKMNSVNVKFDIYIDFDAEHDVINGRKGEEIIGMFYEKELQKTS